jgi:hypothetical protein
MIHQKPAARFGILGEQTPRTRRRYNVIAKGFESQQQTLMAHAMRISGLEEELARLKRSKKRKSIPNPNKRFMTLGEALASGEANTEMESEKKHAVVNYGPSGESGSESEAGSVTNDGDGRGQNTIFKPQAVM